MRDKLFTIIILAGIGLIAGACEEKTYEFGEPFSKIEGINGSFVLTQVVQADERSTNLDNTFDISEFFIGSEPAVINFQSSDFSYTLNPGTAPNFLGASAGSWKFDDNEFPTQIQLGTASPTILDLNHTIRTIDNTLEFKITKSCSGEAGVSYHYVFTRRE